MAAVGKNRHVIVYTVRMAYPDIDSIDAFLKESGVFITRSEFIRFAVMDYIVHGGDLPEDVPSIPVGRNVTVDMPPAVNSVLEAHFPTRSSGIRRCALRYLSIIKKAMQ